MSDPLVAPTGPDPATTTDLAAPHAAPVTQPDPPDLVGGRRRRPAWWASAIICAAVLAAALAVTVPSWLSAAPTDSARLGTCLHGHTAHSLTVVDCGSGHDWTVVARLERVSTADWNRHQVDLCSAYPAATAAYYRPDSGAGYLLCLAPAGG